MVDHFMHLYALSIKCIIFKWHKHIIKSSISQKYLWIKIANLNKNIYRRVKFNKHTPIYNNEPLKWTYGLWFRFCINIQMHFLLWFYFNIFYKDSIYDAWWGKKWIEKHYNKNFDQQIAMNFWMTKFGPYFQKSISSGHFLLNWYFFPPNMYIK
jgi:hypothetical protein